jgi:four helix bundle protein
VPLFKSKIGAQRVHLRYRLLARLRLRNLFQKTTILYKIPITNFRPGMSLFMHYFHHEKLDVYQAAKEFMLITETMIKQFPKGRAYLRDQLQRAASSILLNIAEGSGEFSSSEKIRFYRMARRSATECAGILDICIDLKLIHEDIRLQARTTLLRIVAMLTKMTQVRSQSQAG